MPIATTGASDAAGTAAAAAVPITPSRAAVAAGAAVGRGDAAALGTAAPLGVAGVLPAAPDAAPPALPSSVSRMPSGVFFTASRTVVPAVSGDLGLDVDDGIADRERGDAFAEERKHLAPR